MIVYCLAAAYLLFIGSVFKTKDLWSSVVFKTVPIGLSMACLLAAFGTI